MSWAYSHQSNIPYVDSQQSAAQLPTTPAQNFTSNWPTPSTQPRLIGTPTATEHQQQEQDSTHKARVADAQEKGLGLYVNTSLPTQPAFGRAAYSTPIAQPRRTPLSPATFYTPSSLPRFTSQTSTSASLYTPPLTADQFVPPPQNQYHQTTQVHIMTQRRMSSHGQRPVMGPPETPSRGMIPQSPSLFPNIQFSPDLFSQQMIESQSAPIYPQQRLFWDPSTATPLPTTPSHFHTPAPFTDDFNTSFNSSSTIMPQTYASAQQDMPYDLPTVSQSFSASFMDGSVFPAPFQTSPRLVPPPAENPTQFLSSPARRFGGETKVDMPNPRRPLPNLPAYHHQMRESKREKEMMARERRKSRSQKRTTDEDLVMKSVRRALSPGRISRPNLTRSATFGGTQSSARRSSSTLDNVSVGSSVSSRSTRGGRSSPLKQTRDFTRHSSSSSSAVLRSKSSVTLEIDKNGVARTIMNALPENTDEEMEDEYMTDRISSEDDDDQHIMYSFSGDPYGNDGSFLAHGDARDELRSNAHLTMGSDRVARVSQAVPALDPRLGGHDPRSTIRRVRGETLTSNNTDPTNGGNAQQALRALMQDRSRSASSHASTSSVQFHSSPPLQQGHLPGYNASPTTITDPDLATPSTDVDSLGSSGATRCVCNSGSPDGNIMIQCDACQKWLHAKCVGLTNRNIPDVYVCVFCEQTPMRGGTVRPTMRQPSFHQSPLAHKSHRLR